MKKARNQFVIYAMFSIFVLLTVLMFVINAISFTMASEDADRLTMRIKEEHGSLKPFQNEQQFDLKKKVGPMGPDSPEMKSSIRYFTVEFDKENDYEARLVEYQISAVSEDEAISWARKLLGQKTGWTKTTYRFRVFKEDGKVYVTVIDQGRELLVSYRILIISVCGEVFFLLLSLVLFIIMGKRVFKPLEEADRKQKKFIASVESEFKLPLTIINANTEIMEKENGVTENILSINKQVKKMFRLVKDFGYLGIVNEKNMMNTDIHLSDMFNELLDMRKPQFAEKGLELKMEITPEVTVRGDEEILRKMINEVIDNAIKYSISSALFVLSYHNERVRIMETNDTTLPGGNIDQVFDRFVTLGNAKGKSSRGLGLSYVKEVVRAHNGRVFAKVNSGMFVLQIDF